MNGDKWWWKPAYVLREPRLWVTADGRRAIRYGLRIGVHVLLEVRASRARARMC